MRAKVVLLANFAKPTVVANAHVKCITSLVVASGAHPYCIHHFLKKLYVSVQALDTIKKLKEINGYVKIALDKLLVTRSNLVKFDDDWQEWGFPDLTGALRKQTDHNSRIFHLEKNPKQDNLFHSKKIENLPEIGSVCIVRRKSINLARVAQLVKYQTTG